MPPPRDALADLHRRYDGPIPDILRDHAIAGGAWRVGQRPGRASRDIDRLARMAARSLAHLRASAENAAAVPRLETDQAAMRLATTLRSYRSIGLKLIEAARLPATDR